MPTPRHHTEATPGARSYVGAIGKLAVGLGRPLIPWQHDAVRVATELDGDRFRYPLVLVTVPRQSGKTVVSLGVSLHRAIHLTGGRIWYTAQSGIKAREQLTEMIEHAERTALAPMLSCKRGAGDTRIDVPMTGGRIKAHPPTGNYLHGNQSDLNVIDEGWDLKEPDAIALMGAIVPTQLTRSNPQTWIVSTEGTADSVWFHGLIDAARADALPGACLVDYGIGPGVDSEDIDAVAAAHPAVGHTCTVDDIRAARPSLSAGEFARAYGNRRTGAADRLISVDRWNDAQTTASIPAGARPAFGVAVSIDRDETAIVAAAPVDGVPVLELVDVRPGWRWAIDRVPQLAAAHLHHGVAIDRHGPSGALADELDVAGVELAKIGTREVCAAAAQLVDGIDPPEGAPAIVHVRTDAAFDAAAEILAKRPVGDAFALSRRTLGSIAPMEAASLALYALLHQDGEETAPEVWFG
ncbi:terminase [Nocardia sp. NPDC060259]|uniref:terminase n=1 Tax=Nocardia sp. NPDC060259 TaxID=3347088 RepID=UPI00365EA5A9